jgi:hypothetical protein
MKLDSLEAFTIDNPKSPETQKGISLVTFGEFAEEFLKRREA